MRRRHWLCSPTKSFPTRRSNNGHAISRANCAAWCVKINRSTIPDAPFARDLRLLVRERLKAGDGDQQVLDFLTVRYGDFVLLNPPLNWRTALLWRCRPDYLSLAAWFCW